MELGLEGKSVVVTGAAAGIGLATVQLFAAEGARVVAVDVDVAGLADVDAGAGEIRPLQADLSTAEGATASIEAAVSAFGTIDVLVNNVGIGPTREGFLQIPDEEWQRVFDLNFFSMVRCSRAGTTVASAQSSKYLPVMPATSGEAASSTEVAAP